MSGSALIIDVDSALPSKIAIRDNTATSGVLPQKSVIGPLQITVPSGATLDHEDATDGHIYVHLVDNGNYLNLGVSSLAWDNGALKTTVLLDATSDEGDLYSAIAITDAAVVPIARLLSNQTTAGTWASNATEISVGKFEVFANRKFADSTGTFGTTSGTLVDVTNATADITVRDNKSVRLSFTSDGTNVAFFAAERTTASTDAETEFAFFRDSTQIATQRLKNDSAAASAEIRVGAGAFQAIDENPGAGRYTYKLQARRITSSTNAEVEDMILVVEEI